MLNNVMRLTDIGHQLKAFRLESGLKADEIAHRLGISRAALYRYEKGEVIKLDTVQRLAELLQVSPLSLLGIGVEYYQRPTAYLERVRQIEESADTILIVGGGAAFLASTAAFEALVIARLRQPIAGARTGEGTNRAVLEATIESLEARRATFFRRQPTLVALFSTADIARLVDLLPSGNDDAAIASRDLLTREVERLVGMMETPPLGVQLGLIRPSEGVPASFRLMRQRDRTMLAINPFRTTCGPGQNAVAIVTGASEAVAPHQRVAEMLWQSALRGGEAAGLIRDTFAEALRRR